MASKKYLGSIIPFVLDLAKALGVGTKEEALRKLKGDGSNLVIKGSGNVPDAIKLSVQDVVDLGFDVNFYLKSATKLCPDDLDNSAVIIASIQHRDPVGCLVADGLTRQLDPITEIEASTIMTKIVATEIPDAYGVNYDLEKLLIVSSERIDEIIKRKIEDKKIRDAKIAKYEKDPELAQKHSRKALENLKLKHKVLESKNAKTADDINEFNNHLLRLIENILDINGLKSFKDLKKVPVIAEELARGGSFKDILEKLANMEELNKIREQRELGIPEGITGKIEVIEVTDKSKVTYLNDGVDVIHEDGSVEI